MGVWRGDREEWHSGESRWREEETDEPSDPPPRSSDSPPRGKREGVAEAPHPRSGFRVVSGVSDCWRTGSQTHSTNRGGLAASLMPGPTQAQMVNAGTFSGRDHRATHVNRGLRTT